MKKFKLSLSVILSLIMLCSCAVMPASAEAPLPESEHRYTNNYYGEWDYSYPDKSVKGLFVSFCERTATEKGDENYNIFIDDDENIKIEDVIEEGSQVKVGDIISIYDGKGNLVGTYQGEDLAGQTVYVPDSSFKITLITDGSITAYGFKVVNVTSEIPEHTTVVRYHLPDGSIATDCLYGGVPEINNGFKHFISGDEAIIGWTLPDGSEWLYATGGYYDEVAEDYGEYDLYAISTPVQLTAKDVYSFTNTDEYFDFDGDRYYMTKEDHLRLLSTTCLAGGTVPLALPAAITSTVLISYPRWEWAGACIGFANTVCLQKKGILDVVATQEGATCVRDLEPTPELISLLNYYNAHSAATILPKNKAFVPGTAEYSRQIEKLVKSALEGNIILFEFLPTGTAITQVFSDYHGIVITGAYEVDGGYVLLCYDENNGSYAERGYCQELIVPADFSTIYGYHDNMMFFWTDSFEEFRSLDISGKGNPFIFRIEVFKHIIEVIREWFDTYFLRLFR